MLDPAAERGVGAPGSNPDATPRDATGDPSLNHNVFNDERDATGFPPYHSNLDTGYAPSVRFGLLFRSQAHVALGEEVLQALVVLLTCLSAGKHHHHCPKWERGLHPYTGRRGLLWLLPVRYSGRQDRVDATIVRI